VREVRDHRSFRGRLTTFASSDAAATFVFPLSRWTRRSLSADEKGSQQWVWDEVLDRYLAAVAATVLEQLRARGLRLRYIVDNSYPASETIAGPVAFLRNWFQAAG